MSKVQLAVSSIGGLPGARAYHSSIIVDGEEFSFSIMGILKARGGPLSHAPCGNAPCILDMGVSERSGKDLTTALAVHFLPGTYDLLAKNCNTFSDCALFFLLRRRLNSSYMMLDRMGATLPSLVHFASGGAYRRNPESADFDLEALLRDIHGAEGGFFGGWLLSGCLPPCYEPFKRLGKQPPSKSTDRGGSVTITVSDDSVEVELHHGKEDAVGDGSLGFLDEGGASPRTPLSVHVSRHQRPTTPYARPPKLPRLITEVCRVPSGTPSAPRRGGGAARMRGRTPN